ncbi:type III-B CRISPR module RAMP protein Cmr6 [Bacillaceae bacterium SIJ1]|uniref:type III-B CRISPR module RAMP protein Cmr6 n=1 Tax=Litoribacterium kuwaitense TaxID=1398745 RepID=UPI0013EC1D70|nr:type III-B CRISPR module RAMP protein Cmr6 [Litoribacterium kuwaitense]NGP44605.1 type III-B CRISPR module RAMP protein Cmr6 [Litoribacterium kuwaitense]
MAKGSNQKETADWKVPEFLKREIYKVKEEEDKLVNAHFSYLFHTSQTSKKTKKPDFALLGKYKLLNIDSKGKQYKTQVQQYNDRLKKSLDEKGLVVLSIHTNAALPGMGHPHFLENGLALHKVYGVPYLTGASIKGMTRAWAETSLLYEQEDPQFALKQQFLNQLFGTEENVGALVFYDALFHKFELKQDVMAVHAKQYYQCGGRINPGEGVNPIKFYAVQGGVEVIFELQPTPQLEQLVDFPGGLKALVEQWVTQAFQDFGLGAKKTSGYGRFNHQ